MGLYVIIEVYASCLSNLKGMVRPENFYPPLKRAQKNMQKHVFGSFLARLEVGPI